jgi:integrase
MEEKHMAALKQKLTRTTVARLKARTKSGKQELVWDAELKGFGLLLSGKTNAKTYVVQRDLPDGRTRRITIGSVAEIDPEPAREEAEELIHQMRSGDPKARRTSPARWTLKKALDEYIAARKGLREKTVAYYRDELNRNLGDWMDRPLRSITGDMAEDKHRAIQAGIARRRFQPAHFQSEIGGVTANTALRIFGMIWEFVLDRDETLGRNPVRRLRRQWFDMPRRTREVPEDKLAAFYQAVDGLPNPVFGDCIKLELFTGLRRNEVMALSWDEVKFAEGMIRLPPARTKTGRKTGNAFNLPMSSFVYELLVARRALGNAGGWVFPGQKKGHITDPYLKFKAVAAASGVAVSSHDLRRTFISVAKDIGVDPLDRKLLLNHAIGDVTDGYVQTRMKTLRKEGQRLCDRLVELCGVPVPAGDNVAKLG